MRRRGTTTARGLSARGRVSVVAGLVVGVAGLGGCSGSPEPAPTQWWTPVYDSPWPEPTPTPTPTPTDAAAVPPERPEAMDTVDTAGAEAAAAYYLQLVPYAEATGDTTTLAAMSHPDCIFCASVLDGVAALVAAGQHNSGGLAHISEVSALEVDPAKWWTVDVELTQDPSRTLDTTGAQVDEAADTVAYHMDIAVVRDGDRWLVRELSYDVLDRVTT